MKQIAKVIYSQGLTATVEVKRESACSLCHKDCACEGCNKTVKAEAVNQIGAKVGDTVEIDTDSKKVLLYSFLVFVLPIINLLIGFSFRFVSKALGIIMPIVFFFGTYILLFVFIKVKHEKPSIVIQRIL